MHSSTFSVASPAPKKIANGMTNKTDQNSDLFMVFAQRDGEAESQGRGKENLENAEKT